MLEPFRNKPYMLWMYSPGDEDPRKKAIKYFTDKYGIIPQHCIESELKNHLAIGPVPLDNQG